MIRRSSIILAMLIAVAIAITAAGCGDKKSDGSASGMSAPDIVAASKTADLTTNSAMVQGTMSVTLKGDAAKLGQDDPATSALFNAPIGLRIDGAMQKDPKAFDGTVTAVIGGKEVTFGLKYDGTDAWIGYKDKWYETPADFKDTLSQIETQATAASPTEIQSQLDTSKMGGTATVVGTEQIAGVETDHVSTTFDGPVLLKYMGEQMTADGALQDSITGALGAASAADPSAVPAIDESQLAAIKDLLASMTIGTLKLDAWYQTSDHRTVQEEITLSMTFVATLSSMGLEGVDMTGKMTLSNLDQPVTVTAPADALPAGQLDAATAELENLFPSGTGL